MPSSRWLAAGVLLAAIADHAAAQAVHLVGPGQLPTIQAAVDLAAPGDVVLVDAGVYPTFRVGKPLTITAVPSALVQIATKGAVTFTLLPGDRVHLGGLDVEAAGVTIGGGIVSMERCTLRLQRGLRLVQAMAAMRWCAVGAASSSAVQVQDAHLHASDSTFYTLAGSAAPNEHAAVKLAGLCTCQLSLCTLFGTWPANTPWPSVPLHAAGASAANERIWVVDCTLIGGFDASSNVGPCIVAPPLPAPPPVRLHRCTTVGALLGSIATGPVVGLTTPVDMQIGATFTTTMVGEPGHVLLLYAGSNILGPFPIPQAEQPALGFLDTVILGAVVANGNGRADFPFAVPHSVALRHQVLWWRGLDMSTTPWQATPAFVSLVQ
ncbi:MAG TPA: hypothetical protein VF384_17855 [Planctomycetota bacterium]